MAIQVAVIRLPRARRAATMAATLVATMATTETVARVAGHDPDRNEPFRRLASKFQPVGFNILTASWSTS